MTCIVYREGRGTIEFGIECESAACEIEYLEGMLADGWSINPPGYEPPKPEMVEASEDESDDGDAPINPVRLEAKEAGIEGWDTKRIGTLQKLLEA